MVWEGTQGHNMRPNRLSRIYYVYKSSINSVLFVNATIGFSGNLFLVAKALDVMKFQEGHWSCPRKNMSPVGP